MSGELFDPELFERHFPFEREPFAGEAHTSQPASPPPGGSHEETPMNTRAPLYQLRDWQPPNLYVKEGEAVRAARKLAKASKRPVTIDVNYHDGDGWQCLRIEPA